MTAGDARLTTLVSGQVQGVGYRAWARDEMRALGLTGSATNRPDGRVADVLPSWTDLSR